MQFFENGCEIVKDFISENWRSRILQEIESSDASTEISGVRNINKKLKSVAEYLNSIEFKERASHFVSVNAQLVRAILFNKSPESNWFVTWHQDKTVSVSSKFEESGWGGLECKRKYSTCSASFGCSRRHGYNTYSFRLNTERTWLLEGYS